MNQNCTNTMENNTNFYLTNYILSIEEDFTLESLANSISESKKLNVSTQLLRNTIERLRESEYLQEVGFHYHVIAEEKNVRW